MPPSSWLAIFEVLLRYGIDPEIAKPAAMGELRHWEIEDVVAILKRIKRPSLDFRYFAAPASQITETLSEVQDSSNLLRWFPNLWEKDDQWISPPREMMERAVSEQAALCLNAAGQWSLRKSGYVALSHVWIEGLQRDAKRGGLLQEKLDRVFTVLKRAKLASEWIWTDVLVIPGGGSPDASLEDEMLTIDIINTMPLVYANAESVVIFDALLLQLHEESPLDVAVAICLGRWATRVWTFQEIKLAEKALVLTAKASHNFKDLVDLVESYKDSDYDRFHRIWLGLAIMGKDREGRGLSIPDIINACVNRKSGMDIDYARAFFPVLGLKWEYGMTREQGMQVIYNSQKNHATRCACQYGAPRMKLPPAWAPSYFTGLEGITTEPMQWESRGARGEWYVTKVEHVKRTFVRSRKFVLDFEVEREIDRTIQCVLAPNEDSDTIEAMQSVIKSGRGYILSYSSSEQYDTGEFARTVLLAEKSYTQEYDGQEFTIHCAAVLTSPGCHFEKKELVLLRHFGPGDGNLANELKYHWHSLKEDSRPSNLPRQEEESELHAAVRSGDLAAVDQLLAADELMTSYDSRGWTPVHTAAVRGEFTILELLLNKGADVDVRGQQFNEDTPLSLVAEEGHIGSISVLLKHGADIHTRNKHKYTPIMLAAYENRAEVVNALLSAGANPNDSSPDGTTPLLLASSCPGSISTLKALIDAVADVNVSDTTQKTVLHQAAKRGHHENIAYLLSVGANVNAARLTTLWTPLAYALARNSSPGSNASSAINILLNDVKPSETVKLLLDAGADPCTVFQNGYTPVHLAASSGNWENMRLLLNCGVDVNRQTEPDGRTPLHVAVGAKEQIMVKMLLAAGAKVSVVDARGRTALGSAEEAKNKVIIDILRAASEK
jgi:ankyrin repeat protein